jgi:hypothetical protein
MGGHTVDGYPSEVLVVTYMSTMSRERQRMCLAQRGKRRKGVQKNAVRNYVAEMANILWATKYIGVWGVACATVCIEPACGTPGCTMGALRTRVISVPPFSPPTAAKLMWSVGFAQRETPSSIVHHREFETYDGSSPRAQWAYFLRVKSGLRTTPSRTR